MPSVLVLLSTYNGEKYLRAFLDSVLSQIGVAVSILIRDDGSTDGTAQILGEYSQRDNIKILEVGPNLGYAASFWRLLQNACNADYYAFADQDDIWLPEKLSTSIAQISDCAEPSLGSSNVIPVDDSLNRLDIEPFPVHGPLSLAESLKGSILPGCTFVFNEGARKIAARYQGFMESHDWALYAIVTCFGTVRYCDESNILYRIHEGNTIGVTSGWQDLCCKVRRFFSPRTNTRSRFATDLLKTYGDCLDKENKLVINLVASSDTSLRGRLRLATSPLFKGTIFKLYALLGRI